MYYVLCEPYICLSHAIYKCLPESELTVLMWNRPQILKNLTFSAPPPCLNLQPHFQNKCIRFHPSTINLRGTYFLQLCDCVFQVLFTLDKITWSSGKSVKFIGISILVDFSFHLSGHVLRFTT